VHGLPAGSCDHVLVVSRKTVELLGDGFSTSSESSPISHAGVPLAFSKLHVFEPTLQGQCLSIGLTLRTVSKRSFVRAGPFGSLAR
jgi:hypothetical protein